MSTHAFHRGDNAMNDQLRHAFEVAQVRASQLSDVAQNLIASRLLEEIEKQEQQIAENQPHKESFEIAGKDEVMKLFYEEIEPQYEKLFERLAK